MALLGASLTLLVGPTIAVPAPRPVTEAIQRIEVTHSDDSRSGFQITFEAGRSGPGHAVDHPLLAGQLLKPFNRVVLLVRFGARMRVLMDGIITHQQLAPGGAGGSGTFTITGEDVSVMMDLEEKDVEHPAQPDALVATMIIASYAQYGLIPKVIPPQVIDVPIPVQRVPVQCETDLQHLIRMAQRHGHVFYVKPGPAPMVNTAYWGPPERLSAPQRALSVDMGQQTNVDGLEFRNSSLAPTMVEGSVQDSTTNQSMPVRSLPSMRLPLAAMPTWLVQQPNVRKVRYRDSGVTAMQAMGRAQGTFEATTDTLTADGELDATRYGDLLEPRRVVGLRGAGYRHDGLYYVKKVTHVIDRATGDYRQRFVLSRDGVGSTTPVVVP